MLCECFFYVGEQDKSFLLTASFYEQFGSELDTKSGDWKTISRKKYERFTNDPYPPNTPTNTLVNMVETLKTRHLVSNSERKELNSLIEFRNGITHQSMFHLNKITDEHIDRIMRCFRYIDRKLKSIRRKYLRREKELRGEK